MIGYQYITANQNIVRDFNIINRCNVNAVHKNYVVADRYLRLVCLAAIRGNCFYPKIIASSEIGPQTDKFNTSDF